MKFLLLISFVFYAFSYPDQTCPLFYQQSGIVQDLALLSDAISSYPIGADVLGVCGPYTCIEQTEGIYQTRMRIYKNQNQDHFIIFRPTQQTPEGTSIHVDRQLVPCDLWENCSGLVMDKFQNAFLSLIDNSLNLGENTFISGHSLGGVFAVMMGLYLYNVYNIVPQIILNLAGPFFGDIEFNRLYLEPLKEIMGEKLQFIETINQYNLSEFDGTIEGYNTPNFPFINIAPNLICGIPINKLSDSYGMHDLRNYQLFFTGKNCLI
jgi:hypothetical protein